MARLSHPLWAEVANMLARGMWQCDVEKAIDMSPGTITRWKKNSTFAKLLKEESVRHLKKQARSFDGREVAHRKRGEAADYQDALREQSRKLRKQ